MKKIFPCIALGIALLAAAASGAHAFTKEGCGSGECKDCHALTPAQAATLLGPLVDNVITVEQSPVKGLWVVDVLKEGNKFPIYIDYAKQYVISGQVVRISTRKNYSGERFQKLNKIDPSKIPLAGSIVIGKAGAKRKIIVFSNPDCPHCANLHQEIRKIVAIHPDVAFHVKILPGRDPDTVAKTRAIICGKTPAKLLEDAFAGKELPPAPTSCKAETVEESIKTADSLGVRVTPTLVYPDGLIIGRFQTAEEIDATLKEAEATTADKGK